ncbi:MAG: RNA polymerase sigma-70 factor [Chitinophagaceae bacterium]|nr:RNA polymerase sigma-70 factor [Chitinophagaceae bacterium]
MTKTLDSTTIEPERQLFSRIANGDKAAFTEIYLRYTEKLYPHVVKLLESELWAEEIIQDVFTKIWSAKETLAAVENPSAYLYKIAGNKTLDFLKHRSVEIKMQYRISRLTEQWSRLDTQDELDFKQSDTEFRKAINSLPTQQQKIFKLKHEHNMSYEEIAAELQLSKNTVRNHLTRAMESVRAHLLEKGLLIIFCLNNM